MLGSFSTEKEDSKGGEHHSKGGVDRTDVCLGERATHNFLEFFFAALVLQILADSIEHYDRVSHRVAEDSENPGYEKKVNFQSKIMTKNHKYSGWNNDIMHQGHDDRETVFP